MGGVTTSREAAPDEDTPPLTGSSWRTDLFDVPEYLDVVGVAAGEPSLDLLGRLHRAHVHTIPFANVDVLLGRHPGVTPDRIQERLVRTRRGGYCFEHAQLFAAALEHLGFRVRRALGRVGSISGFRTHMTVVVRLDGRAWLCDPGFGFSVTGPIALEDGASRDEGGRRFGVERADDAGSGVWVLTLDGRPQHYSDELTVHPADVLAGHLVTSRGDHSPFPRRLMAMRHTPAGHVTVTEWARTVRAPGEATRHEDLTVDEVVDAVRDLGVDLGAEAGALARRLREIR